VSERKIIIIGGGPGGYVAAIRAAQLGAQVSLVEKDNIGGTCLNRGCIPTKSLLHDAGLLQKIKQSSVFNPILSKTFSPFAAMMKRKNKVVKTIVEGVGFLLNSFQIEVIKADAELKSSRQVVISRENQNKEILEADRIIIASGSKVSTPPDFTPNRESIITSEEALSLETLPQHIVIIGGGYIGMEFATFFCALGTRVTVIEVMDNILTGLDDELTRNSRRFLEQKGVKILTGTTLQSITETDNGVQVRATSPKDQFEIPAEKVLMATGRTPNVSPDISKAGIDCSADGIKVNQRMETNISGVYAVGDVVGGIQLAHVATEEGEIAAENACDLNRSKETHDIPFCVFTHPEIAGIGMTEKEARKRGPVTVGRFPYRANPTAIIHDDADGFIKVVIDLESDRILGIHILGHEASTLLSTASSLIYQDVKGKDFAGCMQAHPTTSETLKEAFLCAYGAAIHAPKPLKPKK
jgi:dihydrolipoamide dehydrogenase